METWPLEQTSLALELERSPETRLYQSRLGLKSRFMEGLVNIGFMKDRLPPGFRRTMGSPDIRLEEMAMGLGVEAGGEAVFYPLENIGQGLRDSLAGRELSLELDINGVPKAAWLDEPDKVPLQIFSRWYGFAYTYPGCRIHWLE